MQNNDQDTLPLEILEAAQKTGLLDTEPDKALDRLTALASRLAGAPTALLTILDENRQYLKSVVGLPKALEARTETPLSHSFCKLVAQRNSALVVSDAEQHPSTQNNPAVLDYEIKAYCGVPLRLSDGVPFGALCVIDDHPRTWEDGLPEILEELARSAITEIELRQKTKTLEEIRLRQDEILGTVAHDLRTPLAVISGYSNMLLNPELSLPEPSQVMVRAIQRSGNFMLRLVDDLLDLETLKSGRVQLRIEDVEIVELFETVIELSQLRADFKGVRIQFHSNVETWRMRLDGRKFEQVLVNIIDNAVKFTPARSVVTVDLDVGSKSLLVRVTDQGPGISKDEAVKIFEPFAVGKAQGTNGEKSTGLGLAIVKGIVEAHGGTASAFGNSDGAVFQIEVPVSAAAR